MRVAGRIPGRLLRVADAADLGHSPPAGDAHRRDRDDLRRVGRDLRSPPGHRDPARQGKAAGVKQVASIMREVDLVACQPRPYKRTTFGDRAGAAPDLLDRDFTTDRPRHKLVGDITYVWTWEGWLYLATVIDCFSRQVIGWSMAEHMRAQLVVDALTMAAGNGSLDKEAIFHSDRGSQYSSARFRAALDVHRVRQSMGRTGVCSDNALAESFFGALKTESFTGSPSRHADTPAPLLPTTSRPSTIGGVSIQASDTAHHSTSSTSTTASALRPNKAGS